MSRVPSFSFEISWTDEYGYRVSVPRLLEESERLAVVPLSEYQALVDSIGALLPRVYDGTHLVDCPYVDVLMRIREVVASGGSL